MQMLFIDDADEVTAYVADITSGALALTNQTVTVDSRSKSRCYGCEKDCE